MSGRSPHERARPDTGRSSAHAGVEWEQLAQEVGFGSAVPCRRWLATWNEAGAWENLHVLLEKLWAT
ncbi:hypothetical protein [Streptomyces sp. UH6]|uniref:hypothetical protein n=1 Tax=Streptomyces sp. UH6 TaxID=2748379 RepID=UPI0015D4778B|nr:hypothetical protein [Streptomyces sp. UH6]NYV72948.1 hypothetical protein [Streptomyces sp. UH6]